MSDRAFVNIADLLDSAIWLDVDEVEAVIARGGSSEVRTRGGTVYRTGRTARDVVESLRTASA